MEVYVKLHNIRKNKLIKSFLIYTRDYEKHTEPKVGQEIIYTIIYISLGNNTINSTLSPQIN